MRGLRFIRSLSRCTSPENRHASRYPFGSCTDEVDDRRCPSRVALKGQTGGAGAPPAGFVLQAPARLESQAESELYDARIAGRRDLPEQRRSDGLVRVVKLRVIEHIEEIGAQFRSHALAPERRDLGDGQVYVGARRPAKRVAAERAICTQRGPLAR